MSRPCPRVGTTLYRMLAWGQNWACCIVHNQSMDEHETMRRSVQAWKDTGPRLEAIRHREIREADNLQVLALLESAFNHALRTMPARPSSGLVEMQAWLAKLRL
jgi:hypothetical protein